MNKSHIRKKKAFTLTELLVVVIVIGVLSAVVLPKFSKVLETRKTTEAEELMSAVRTEQERRCTLDKQYLTSLTEVKDIVPAQNTKNFSYSLTTTGMEASSKGKYGYKLRMPSYKDGRICCENEAECAKLNKDYPLCSALVARADYQSGAECAGEPEEKQCTGSSTQSCGCKNGGTQTRTCDTSTGTWSGWSACSISDACSCEGEKPGDKEQNCNDCGTQTASYSCNTSNGQWVLGSWSACSVSDASECKKECPAGKVWDGNQCVCENSKEKEWCVFEVTCSDGSTAMETWNDETCQCEDPCSNNTEPPGEPGYLRCSRMSYQEAAMGQSTHSSKAAAKEACEKYGQSVAFYEVHYPTMDCPAPNKPCTTTSGWGAVWTCSQDSRCGGGIGQLDRCSCYYGVG